MTDVTEFRLPRHKPMNPVTAELVRYEQKSIRARLRYERDREEYLLRDQGNALRRRR